jgi:thiamine-phosphate pyrophosphorylase
MIGRIVKGLYAIVDLDFLSQRGVDPLAFTDAVLTARPGALQLRAKSAGARDTLALLRELKLRASAAGVPLFANDRPDLAILAGCSGVHLGQSDLPLDDARRLAPELQLGVSTHDLDQLDRALLARPAYVALGPVFPTQSKRDPEPVVGLDALAEAGRRCRTAGVPLVAIGGLTLDNLPSVVAHAAAGALISALLPAAGLGGVARAAAEIGQIFRTASDAP